MHEVKKTKSLIFAASLLILFWSEIIQVQHWISGVLFEGPPKSFRLILGGNMIVIHEIIVIKSDWATEWQTSIANLKL